MAGIVWRKDLLEEVVCWPLGLGGGGHVLLGFLPIFLLFHIGGNDPLGPLQVVADNESRVVQGHAAL